MRGKRGALQLAFLQPGMDSVEAQGRLRDNFDFVTANSGKVFSMIAGRGSCHIHPTDFANTQQYERRLLDQFFDHKTLIATLQATPIVKECVLVETDSALHPAVSTVHHFSLLADLSLDEVSAILIERFGNPDFHNTSIDKTSMLLGWKTQYGGEPSATLSASLRLSHSSLSGFERPVLVSRLVLR